VRSLGAVLVVLGAAVAAAASVPRESEDGDEGKLPAPGEVAERVDAHFERGWRDRGLTPSPPASDPEFLRRLSLDLRGTIPSAAEIRAFLEDSGAGRDGAWIEAFLGSREFHEYASRILTDLLLGTEPAPGARPGILRLWIEEALRSGRPWHRLVAELLTAQHPREWFGPTNFVLRWGASPAELAGVTSRVFLGTQIQCAQCHDHPTEPFTREDFHAFAAFFTDLSRESLNIRKMGLPDAAYGMSIRALTVPGREMLFDASTKEYSLSEIEKRAPDPLSEPGAAADEEEPRMVEMSSAAATAAAPPPAKPGERGEGVRVVKPRFLRGREIEIAPGRNRQQALADAILTDGRRALARTFANRVVAWLLGRGIVEPVDDFSAANPPSHPEILDLLTDDVLGSEFDVKRLFRVVLGTRAYRLSSAPEPGNAKDAGDGFSRHPVRQLNGHQLFGAIERATGQKPTVDPRAEAAYATIRSLDRAWHATADGPLSRPKEVLLVLEPDVREKMARWGEDVPLGLLDPTALDPREIRRAAFLRKLRGDEPPNAGDDDSCLRTIQQVLLHMNGKFLDEGLRDLELEAAGDGPPGADGSAPLRSRVEAAFRAALGRAPSEREAEIAVRAVSEAAEGETEALRDLVWALVNTSEFLLNR